MSEWPVHGAFPHQHGDARGLMERIEAQLRERIEEAVEMAALKLMVDRRTATGRPRPRAPAPPTVPSSRPARVPSSRGCATRTWPSCRRTCARASTRPRPPRATSPRACSPGQVWLARRLPDYWQRFERYQRQYALEQLADPAGPGWLKRLFG